MKKLVFVILSLAMIVCFCACGSGSDNPGGEVLQAPCAHEYQIANTENATCTETGMLYYRCDKCGHEFRMEQPKLMHNFSGGSCTVSGVCTICGAKEGDPMGHRYDDDDICTLCGFQNASQGLEFTPNSSATGYIVTGIGTCLDADLVIPKSYQDMPVTGIGNWAFKNCTNLTSVTIPITVMTIGNDAFNGCTGLKNISIPSSVTTIKKSTFEGCTSLISIYIPDSVTTIGESAFRYCSSLASITIPDSVTSIDGGAFTDCVSLTSIVIPSSVTYIGGWLFWGCNELTSISVAPDNPVYHSEGNCLIQTANKMLLSGCPTSVIPSDGSVTDIAELALGGFTDLTHITIPGSVTRIANRAFTGCNSVISISVDSDNSVYHSAGNCLIHTAYKTLVWGCGNSVIPSDGTVTRIGDDAFAGNTSLSAITIPDTVTAIEGNPFYGCRAFTSIIFNGTMNQWDKIEKDFSWEDAMSGCTIYCNDGEIRL